MLRCVAVIAVALGALPATARAGAAPRPRAPGYLGTDACAACHPAIARAWRATAHARATRALDRDQATSPRCRVCHATGWAPAGRSPLPGVQCEACHGPGADYAAGDDVMRDRTLARLLGLADLSTPEAKEALCRRCHRPGQSTRLAGFDPDEAWRRIQHMGGGR